ncbi:MAG: hypothetical protein PGN29_04750 [Gordonia paraffinivorans]
MTDAPTERRTPSARRLERDRFRRRRTRTRATIAAVSTVVVLGALAALVVTSPGWDRVQATFFSASDAAAALPDVAEAFWLNIRLFLVVEVFVLALGLLVAVIRVMPSPALAPLKLVAVVYTDVFRGTPTLLVGAARRVRHTGTATDGVRRRACSGWAPSR